MSRAHLEVLLRKSPAALARNPHLKVFLELPSKSGDAKKRAATPHPAETWKSGWRTVGRQRIYARSRWEANYARYLEFLRASGAIRSWGHEKKTFWFKGIKRGTCSYLPDFRVTGKDGRASYHEVKGWMDARSRTKLSRMKKYYPKVEIVLIDAGWFSANSRKLRSILPEWETQDGPVAFAAVRVSRTAASGGADELVFQQVVTLE